MKIIQIFPWILSAGDQTAFFMGFFGLVLGKGLIFFDFGGELVSGG
jgi:hypothetical protein